MVVFMRDGFVDRYSGKLLVFPGTLRLIHKILPSEFPFQKNWKMSETHIAFWDLLPTMDHVVPIARGGTDSVENLVSTSQLKNSIKSNWLLEELGWQLHPISNNVEWVGLTGWFLEYVDRNPEYLTDPYIRAWRNAALPFQPVLRKDQESL